jgi:hypothetical protein
VTLRNDKNAGWRFNQPFLDRVKTIAGRNGMGANTLVRVIMLEWMDEEEARYAEARKSRDNRKNK